MLFKRLYILLASLKTSVWILSGMLICYFLGTLFPQGADIEEYKTAGGRFLRFVEVFDLLNVFSSPFFIFLSVLLCLNLMVCIINRMVKFRKRTEIHKGLLQGRGILELRSENVPEVKNRLTGAGFRLIAEEVGQYVYGKGLPYWWLSWIYHLGIVLAVVGFFITALTAHEDYLVLKKDKPVKFSLYDPKTRWNRILRKLGVSVAESGYFEIRQIDFKTEFYRNLDFEYPSDPLTRLSIGLGFKSIKPYREGGIVPKMWSTSFLLITPEGERIEGSTEVNRPFRKGGLTLYQMGYDQKIHIQINEKIRTVEPFRKIDLTEGSIILSSVKTGRLYERDGRVVELPPTLVVYERAGKIKKRIGLLKKGQSLYYKGNKIKFQDYEDNSVLSYRVDRGVTLVAIASALVFVGLLLRAYGGWYRIRIFEMDTSSYLMISTRGILANKTKVTRILSDLL